MHSQWVHAGAVIRPVGATFPKLEPGVYTIQPTNEGPVLLPMRTRADTLYTLPDAPMGQVLSEIGRFWELKRNFDVRGLVHKRGILMYGPPGSGKSATIAMTAQRMVDAGGVCLHVSDGGWASRALAMIRGIEAERPMTGFIEDIDEYTEGEFLSLLDGENQVGGIVWVATTNHPEDLDARLLDRPSRFDLVIQVGMPTAAARRFYLSKVEPSLTEAELKDWVSATDKFSIAYLRELIILTRCYELSLEKAVARLKAMQANASALAKLGEEKRLKFGNRR